MSESHPRERSRSRSPKPTVQGTKLHISNLPLDYVNSDLERIFSPYGKIEDIRIIRKGSNGQPLKETCYGFVLMSNEREAKAAMAKLNELGWTVSWSRESMERQVKMRERQVQELPMPSIHALCHNAQATHLMLTNNANPNPGAPVANHFVENLLAENHPNAFNMSEIPYPFATCFLVREVWIGNISPATEKKTLYDTFKVYGDIEGIEMFCSKGFSFIKYRKIISATLAYQYAQQALVDGRPVKVAFADPTRRIDIVGNSNNQNDPEFDPIADDNFKSLYLAYSQGIIVPSETKLREVFSRFGQVKGIYIKQTKGNAKPYAFVDFERGDQAANARRALYIEDREERKRIELGDPKLEISFNNTNNIVSRTGVKNGTRFQFKAGKEEISEIAKRLMQRPPDFLSTMQDPRAMSTFGNQPGFTPQPQAPQEPPQQPPQQQQIPQQSTPPPREDEMQEDQTNIGNVVWSGFMTRSKQHRIGIDATLIKGNIYDLADTYHLNIQYRVRFTELTKYQLLGVLTLEASNELQQNEFNRYIQYFQSKKRGGFIQLKQNGMYIVPPCSEAQEFCQAVRENQLLGIIVNRSKKNETLPQQSNVNEGLAKLLSNPEIARRMAAIEQGASPNDPRLAYRT